MSDLSLISECRVYLSDLERAIDASDHRLRDALGYSKSTFDRIRSDLTHGTDSPFVNDKLRDKLSALRNLFCNIANRQAYKINVKQYKENVLSEISSLPEGSMYSLLSVPPPLETVYPDIRTELVIAATKNKVKFRYYYPAEDWHMRMMSQFMYPPHRQPPESYQEQEREAIRTSILKDAEQVRAFRDTFSWLADSHAQTTRLRGDIALLARHLDVSTGSAKLRSGLNGAVEWTGEHIDAVAERIVFRPLNWVPISFESKIIWITRPHSRHSIRTEMLTPTEQTSSKSIYDPEQIWTIVPDTYSATALRSIIRMAAKRDPQTMKLVDEKPPTAIMANDSVQSSPTRSVLGI